MMRNKPLPLPEINPSHPVHSLITVLTELHQLVYSDKENKKQSVLLAIIDGK
jgi:hypothetical protein